MDALGPPTLPTDLVPPLHGPLVLEPQSTTLGYMNFFVMALQLAASGGHVSYKAAIGSNTLTVTDLVSGKRRQYKVPTSMGGVVNQIPR